MKKSFMSISMLVVSISMVAMFVCSCAASAQVSSSKYIYDKKENTETVFTLDESGKYLTPKVKYEYSNNENGTTKVAYRWNSLAGEWAPSYKLVLSETSQSSIIEFASWNDNTKSYSLNSQKAIYNKDIDNDILSYVLYKWNPSDSNWEMRQNLLLQDYLASTAKSTN